MNRWEDLEELFVRCAEDDLMRWGEVDPVYAAFRGTALQFLAWLRPFEKGAYADPLIELCALAMPLRSDRLALALTGRVWSMDDPIAPVTDEGDLRQRALVLTFVDGSAGRARLWTVLRPFDIEHGRVSWHDRQHLDGGEGWIGEALQTCVRKRRRLPADLAAMRSQAVRLIDLGHQLYLAENVAQRLDAVTP